ncbi:MAG TPA: hypothetical protein VGT01_09045 [Candidatus Dormibacteraeota bacterium]|nr:hypothetical protein [Candidatus Dormibacteraeota bacterium]
MKSKGALIIILFTTFVLGSFGGYFIRTATASPAEVSASTACTVGAHPVVWYSAHTWSCLGD